MKLRRIRRALKNRANWSSIIILALALASAMVGLFMPDDDWSVRALSLAVGLITLEFFILIVMHLEKIQDTSESTRNSVKKLQESECEGVHIHKFDGTNQHVIIEEANRDLFFSGNVLGRLTGLPNHLLQNIDDNIRVRILIADIRDEEVHKNLLDVLGGKAAAPSLVHIETLLHKKNIEVRTLDFPQTIHIAARDINDEDGYMEVGYFHYGEPGWNTPTVKITQENEEWYKYYMDIINKLWRKGAPWTPNQTEPGKDKTYIEI